LINKGFPYKSTRPPEYGETPWLRDLKVIDSEHRPLLAISRPCRTAGVL
jgi:hypothetical protein